MAQIPDTKRLQQLARKFLQGTISGSEQKELDDWFLSQDELLDNQKQVEFSEDDQRKALFARIQKEIRSSPQQKVKTLWPRVAAAASILLFLSIGSYVYFNRHKAVKQLASNHSVDIKPGSNKAILTLSNGQKISLTDAKSGNIAQQSGIQIKKTSSGQVIYLGTKNAKNTEVAYNTISTPRGGQSTLITLPDGSKVMLDAESSITYPVPFSGNKRLVKMTGEVFFDPKHNPAQPFQVNYKGLISEDIGTQFNINAYDDEPAVKTTLLEGKISITKNGEKKLLKPGQQAISTIISNSLKIEEVDTDDVMAWKNGYFQFTDEPLESIMRKVSRWYNVDVEYQNNNLKTKTFNGTISKYKNVSQILRKLAITDAVHFKIDHNKIIILN